MRVAYLVSRYPAVSHTFVLREVQALRKRGVEIDTFSVRKATPGELLADVDRAEASRTFSILPVERRRLAAALLTALVRRPRTVAGASMKALALRPAGLRGAVWQLFYLLEAAVLWDECRRRGLRHVHVHFANVGADVARLAAQIGGKGWTWSFTMHGPTELSDVGAHRLAAKVEAARFVVCISDYARSQLMALVGEEHWGKLHVVRCGIDPGGDGTPAAEGGAAGALSIVCVGRLVPAKGQAVLVGALKELRGRNVAAELTFVGDGPDRERLQRLVARLGLDGHVSFAGAVGHDVVAGFYAEADVFCLPSFAEGVPIVLMEAMARGLPVVSTRIAGIPELVEDGVSGLLCPAGREDLLADALQRLAAAPELRAALGVAGAAVVRDGWSLDRSADGLVALMRAELAGTRP